jgi:hypothetical protein
MQLNEDTRSALWEAQPYNVECVRGAFQPVGASRWKLVRDAAASGLGCLEATATQCRPFVRAFVKAIRSVLSGVTSETLSKCVRLCQVTNPTRCQMEVTNAHDFDKCLVACLDQYDWQVRAGTDQVQLLSDAICKAIGQSSSRRAGADSSSSMRPARKKRKRSCNAQQLQPDEEVEGTRDAQLVLQLQQEVHVLTLKLEQQKDLTRATVGPRNSPGPYACLIICLINY